MQKPFGTAVIDLDAYHAALASHAEPETKVEILTAVHEPVAEVTAVTLPGAQFNFPGEDAEVSRTLQLDLYDPDHALQLDSDSPADGAVYADRFVRVTQTIASPLLAVPASVYAFTGPLVQFKRNGDVVSVEAQGKEQRARTDVPSLVCQKGMYVVDTIEKIMVQACGESVGRLSFPSNLTEKIPNVVTVGRVEELWPWTVCLKLARSIGKQLFYNGEGVLVLREAPAAPVFTFTPLGPVAVEHDWSTVYNRVDVKGRRTVSAIAQLITHPFSPSRMGRNGVDWQRTLFVSDDKIATNVQAVTVANNELAKASSQDLKVQATVVPVWHLDPLDKGLVGEHVVTLMDASVPLTGENMTIGETERVRTPTR